MQALKGLEFGRLTLVTAPGILGESTMKAALMAGGPIFEVARLPGWNKSFGTTTREDTVRLAKRLVEAQIDLLVFVGGDGTAVDVAQAVGDRVPLLGVPAGVKMFSPVFAQTPDQVVPLLNGLTAGFPTRPVEVLDLDEASYREGAWIVRAQAECRTLDAEGIQVGKGGPLASEADSTADLVAWFQQTREPGVTYVLGAGTTLGGIKKALGGGAPLGVDAWRDDAFVALDANEEQLLDALGAEGPAKILVSPTGNQGCILGRGTAQISPAVLDRVGVDHVIVVATPAKLLGLRELFVDTGDLALDAEFPDYIKVRTDPLTEKVFRLKRGVFHDR